MRIYVASSWRNAHQPGVVEMLRDEGHEVYDFRNPPGRTGFAWSDVDAKWQSWTVPQLAQALRQPVAQAGYWSDRDGMDWAEVCVLVLPCGRSAHLEAGFMAGQSKPVIVYSPESHEPELMYLLCGAYPLVASEGALRRTLYGLQRRQAQYGPGWAFEWFRP